MPKINKDKQLFTVGRVFFLLIVIPLSLMALLIANGIIKVGDTARERTVTILDQKSQEEIKVRAVNVADEVADFLKDREKDLLIATILPATDATYKEFVVKSKNPLWVKKDGKIQKIYEPLYKEMAFVDKSGQERIKVVDGKIANVSQLINVSNPAATPLKEDYFTKAKAYGKGDLYISPVKGLYVNKTEFEKGKRFSGIIRMATPVFDQQGFAGVVTLALDVRHLAKFTDNIVPTQSGYVVEAEAASGNYTFMVDNRGFILSHPNDYHIAGQYADGTPVPAITDKTSAESMAQKGEEVLNLNQIGFMDPTLQSIAREAADGRAGMKEYQFAGRKEFVAYAPIKFYSTDYPKPAGFGWVGMNVDVVKFSAYASATAKKIQSEAKSWITTIMTIIIISVILLFLIMAILVRGITRSIEAEIPLEAQEASKFYDDEDDDK